MSTYFYMVCDDCKEMANAVSRTAGGYCPLIDSHKTLMPFMIIHAEHNIRILSEHHKDLMEVEDKYEEWTEENYISLYDRSRP